MIIAKVDADANKALGKRFGITGFPTLKWFPAGNLAEPEDYTGARDLQSLAAFVELKTKGAAKAKIKPVIRSAVTQIDAYNFDEIALDPAKDVLLEFYAPWCGHCKRLAPIYESIAKTYENEENCVVAQINADEPRNRALAEKYEVKGYPTIKFFPRADPKNLTAGNPPPSTYKGGREEKDFITFLNGKCGVHRVLGGGLNDLAGRLPSLDSLASRLYTARLKEVEGEPGAGDEVHRIAQDAKDFVNRVKGGVNATAEKDRVADYYIRIIDKVITGDGGFIDRETKRLRKILDKHTEAVAANAGSGAGTLSPRKADDVKKRLNILSAFMKRQLSDRVKKAEAEAEEEAKAKAKSAHTAESPSHTKPERAWRTPDRHEL